MITLGNLAFAIGAAALMLLVYGVAHDVRRLLKVELPPRERPERAEPIDYAAELQPISKLPKRVPESPWEDAA